VGNYVKLIAAAQVVAVHVRKINAFGVKPGGGRSAEYGEGLLLRALSAGVHKINVSRRRPGDAARRVLRACSVSV
jgi:hypothetical protein